MHYFPTVTSVYCICILALIPAVCVFDLLQSPQRLKSMNYHEKIEKATERIGAEFIDYRPDTGSWVFEVCVFQRLFSHIP